MSSVFFSVGMSLDGQIVGPNRGPTNPLGDRGTDLHQWVYGTRTFRETLRIGEGGETGPDDDRVAATFTRTGGSIMGKHMFEVGEHNWPEDAPFHTPVFVLTHQARAPWVRTGGTTFCFVTDGIERALRQAREVAGNRDIRIAGGADTIRQFLNAGLVDEFSIAVAPMFMGDGLRLLDGVDAGAVAVDKVAATDSALVTHVNYRVRHGKSSA